MECPKFLAPLALAAFLQACASDERPVLRIVSDATFAPFHFSIEGGTPVTLEEGAGLEPLLTGAVDAIIVDEFDAVEAARESDGQLRVLAQPVARERYAFVLALDRHALKAQLDQALATLEAEGEVAALRARFGVERDAEWPVQIVQIGSGMVVTEGVAQKSGPCSVTIDCPVDGNVREALCGEITAADGSVWEVPGPITDAPALVDVYNECTVGGDNPDFESELSTIVVDEDGSEVTAYLFGDNYFELYANGRFIGRDAVGFTLSTRTRRAIGSPIRSPMQRCSSIGKAISVWGSRIRAIASISVTADSSQASATAPRPARDGSAKCSTSRPSTMRAASRSTPPGTPTLPAVRAATAPWPASVRTRRAPVAARISSSRAIG
jgi:hypothetical protein